MVIERLPRGDIFLIEPLWEELNSLHGIQSTHFKEYFQSMTFSKRCRKLLSMEDLGIFVAKKQTEIIGYCIASYQSKVGEIDSLFVTSKYRNNDIGKELMIISMKWLTDYECSRINVSVAEGNEHILAFYEQFGFKKRSYVLEL